MHISTTPKFPLALLRVILKCLLFPEPEIEDKVIAKLKTLSFANLGRIQVWRGVGWFESLIIPNFLLKQAEHFFGQHAQALEGLQKTSSQHMQKKKSQIYKKEYPVLALKLHIKSKVLFRSHLQWVCKHFVYFEFLICPLPNPPRV